MISAFGWGDREHMQSESSLVQSRLPGSRSKMISSCSMTCVGRFGRRDVNGPVLLCKGMAMSVADKHFTLVTAAARASAALACFLTWSMGLLPGCGRRHDDSKTLESAEELLALCPLRNTDNPRSGFHKQQAGHCLLKSHGTVFW